MGNNGLLSKQKMETYAAELLTPEYSDRVEKRLHYLYNQHFEINGILLFETMVKTLQGYQDYIYEIIKYKPYPKFKNPLKEMSYFDNPKRSRKRLRAQEEIDNARNDKVAKGVFLFGHLLTGIGKLVFSWNDIELVKQEVNNFINRKNELNRLSSETNGVVSIHSVETNSDTVNSELNFNSFSELFDGEEQLNRYIEILKTVTANKGRLVITESGSFKVKQGNKSILISWVEALQEQKIISNSIHKLTLTRLLNNHFKGLELKEDLSMWNKNTIIGPEFKSYFNAQIKKALQKAK